MTNAVTLNGRSTSNAETFANGSGVKFALAVDGSGYQKGSNERQAGFFNIIAFGQPRSEQIAAAVKKGTPVFVVGQLQQSKWQDDQGQNRSSIDVVATQVVLEDLSRSQDNSKDEPNNADNESNDDDSDYIDF